MFLKCHAMTESIQTVGASAEKISEFQQVIEVVESLAPEAQAGMGKINSVQHTEALKDQQL
jgi:hypothetical protein